MDFFFQLVKMNGYAFVRDGRRCGKPELPGAYVRECEFPEIRVEHLAECQMAGRVFGYGVDTGFDRFHDSDAVIPISERVHEQLGDVCLADSRVRGGYKYPVHADPNKVFKAFVT